MLAARRMMFNTRVLATISDNFNRANSPTLLVTDTFNRANSTSVLGTTSDGNATWTTRLGTWGINGNQAYQSQVVGGDLMATIDPGVADCTIQATLATINTSTGTTGLVFRYVSNSDFFLLAAEGPYRIYRNGALLGSGSATPANGDVVKVALLGSAITVFVNGVLDISITNSNSLSATTHGLYTGANDVTSRWDDFLVQTYPTPNPASDGGTWTITSGAWGIDSNQLCMMAEGPGTTGTELDGLVVLERDLGTAACDVSVDLYRVAGSGGSSGLHFARDDQLTGDACYQIWTTGSSFKLRRYSAPSTFVTLATLPMTAWATGTSTLRAVYDGAGGITVYQDGALIGTYADPNPALTGTLVGVSDITSSGVGPSTARFDNFTATQG